MFLCLSIIITPTHLAKRVYFIFYFIYGQKMWLDFFMYYQPNTGRGHCCWCSLTWHSVHIIFLWFVCLGCIYPAELAGNAHACQRRGGQGLPLAGQQLCQPVKMLLWTMNSFLSLSLSICHCFYPPSIPPSHSWFSPLPFCWALQGSDFGCC